MDSEKGWKEFEEEEEEYLFNHRLRNNQDNRFNSEESHPEIYSDIVENGKTKTVEKGEENVPDKINVAAESNSEMHEKNNAGVTIREEIPYSPILPDEVVLTQKKSGFEPEPVKLEEYTQETANLNQDIYLKKEFFVPQNNPQSENPEIEFPKEERIYSEIKPAIIAQPAVEQRYEEDALVKLVGSNYLNSNGEKDELQKGKPLIIEAVKHSHPHKRSEADEVMRNADLRLRSKMINKDAIKAGIALAVIIILVVFLFFSINNSSELNEKGSEINETSDDNATFLKIPVNYSFEKYMAPDYNNYGEEISLMCFLRGEGRVYNNGTQFIDYYAVDDYGNKLYLDFFRLENPNRYNGIFMVNHTTTNLFNVFGSLEKEEDQELKLYVSNINFAVRGYEIKKVD